MSHLLEAALGGHFTSLTGDQSFSDGTPETVEPLAFRTTMAALPTGVSILTTQHGDGVWGMTVGSLTSLSLNPALLLVCLRRTSTALTLLAGCGRFAISVLARDQAAIADTFAQPRDHTASHPFATVGGLPVIDGAVAWLTCSHQRTYTAGDHAIVIGAVLHARQHPGEPLVRHASRYRSLL